MPQLTPSDHFRLKTSESGAQTETSKETNLILRRHLSQQLLLSDIRHEREKTVSLPDHSSLPSLTLTSVRGEEREEEEAEAVLFGW